MSVLKEILRSFNATQEVSPPQADPFIEKPMALTVRPNHPTGLAEKIAPWSATEKARIERDARAAVIGKGGPSRLSR